MKAALKNSKENMGKWSRWIGGAALALALAGPLAPATANAVINDDNDTDTVGHEVIPVEGTAPEPPTAPWTPGGYTGGGSGSSGGPSGGVGGGGGGGGSEPYMTAGEKRVKDAKDTCRKTGGRWNADVFNDPETNITLAGYSCRHRLPNNTYWWRFYDSEGYYRLWCDGDLDVSSCQAP